MQTQTADVIIAQQQAEQADAILRAYQIRVDAGDPATNQVTLDCLLHQADSCRFYAAQMQRRQQQTYTCSRCGSPEAEREGGLCDYCDTALMCEDLRRGG